MSQTESEETTLADTGRQAEEIVREGCEIRSRIRKLMLDAVATRKLELRELGRIAQEVMCAASRSAEDMMPRQRGVVLGEVVAGVGDAYAVAANATRLAFEEAKSRGDSFAREELDRALSDLAAIDALFRETVMRAARSARNSSVQELDDLKSHVERTISSIAPVIADALRTAASHPVGLARDVVTTGMLASRRGAGRLAQEMARLLDDAGKAITGEGR